MNILLCGGCDPSSQTCQENNKFLINEPGTGNVSIYNVITGAGYGINFFEYGEI